MLHLLAAPLIGAIQLFFYTVVYRPLGTLFWHKVGMSFDWTLLLLYEDLLRGKLHAAVLTYFLIAFIYFTLRYNAQFRAAEARQAQLQAQLATARLDALKMQLHPHFLFNTLNAITSLIHTNPAAADEMNSKTIHNPNEFLKYWLIITSSRCRVTLMIN